MCLGISEVNEFIYLRHHANHELFGVDFAPLSQVRRLILILVGEAISLMIVAIATKVRIRRRVQRIAHISGKFRQSKLIRAIEGAYRV
jgi:hypothetical protein